ncbi:hypothetical protein MAJJADAN_00057 [Pseudomonas phage Amjad_SA]|nr:hypothetical protein MAJJADAN_00057 [Pseudomonas phage Amjad_SA]
MAMQKFTLYISASTREWDFGEISFTDYDPTPHPDFQRALICIREVEVDVPEFDPRPQAVAVLQAQVDKERADSQVRISLLLERISKLQAIGHEVAE